MTDLRGCTRYFVAMDDAGFFPVGSTQMSMEITWPAVAGATGYRVYTAEMIAKLARTRVRAKRKALNKSKRQARARTGRR